MTWNYRIMKRKNSDGDLEFMKSTITAMEKLLAGPMTH